MLETKNERERLRFCQVLEVVTWLPLTSITRSECFGKIKKGIHQEVVHEPRRLSGRLLLCLP